MFGRFVRTKLVIIMLVLAAGLGLVVTISAQGSQWAVEYFNNRNLQGQPVLTRNITFIRSYWAKFSPAASLPPDNFSIRWTKTAFFYAGTYRFTLAANDGLRLFIDNTAVIDQWHDQPFTAYTVDRPLSAGNHTLRVEYYDGPNLSQIRFTEQIASGAIGLPVTVAGVPTGVQGKLVAFLHLRGGPGTNFFFTQTLDWGTIVNVVGRNANQTWIQVQFEGQTGWIFAPYVRLLNARVADLPITG
ncbi:MAG: PA14 domain-containing protein [Chloroflexota bacterium]